MSQQQLSLPEMMLTSEFEVHRESLTLIDGGLRDSLHRKTQELRAIAKGARDEEEYGELMSDVYGYDLDAGGGQFMTIVFNSFFATSFALFEHTLTNICGQAQRDARCPIPLRLLGARNTMESAKNYLEALGIKFPSCQSEWAEIKRFREIRNRIMHNGAVLSEGNGDLLTYAQRKQVVSGWRERELSLTRPFCEETLETLKQFIIKVYRAYSRWRLAER